MCSINSYLDSFSEIFGNVYSEFERGGSQAV